MFHVLLIIVASILVVVPALLLYLSNKPAVPTDYQKTTELGGEIEKRYMASGPYEVVKKEEGALHSFSKFLIFYPKELERTNKRYPVIVISNGTGTPLSKFTAIAEHYASFGFVVIDTEETYSWNAFGAEMSLRYLERMNENQTVGDKESLFYQKIDFDNVGIVGHSQGGVSVINAITNTKHSSVYKAAVSISPTNKELAYNLFWDYDATKIQIPILLMSGEGGGDDWVVTKDQLEAIYHDISANKVMMRRKQTPHGEMLYKPDGYVMAWFMWQLQGDETAAEAFMGTQPEILSNTFYTDQQVQLKESE